jgi:hypothetical protein
MAEVKEIDIAGKRVHVRDLRLADRAQLLALHVRVFGPGADEDWYRWKYLQGMGLGTGAWEGGELIAHCGGVPRMMWHQDRMQTGIQLGDVMVAPEWRGVVTRRGPFFQACNGFYSVHVGAQGGHSIGFGFPNDRAMRLPAALKLAWDVGPVHALAWRLDDPRPLGWAWRWTELEPSHADFDRLVETVWHRMRAGGAGLTFGDRGPRYVRWRYLDRPGRSSRFFCLRRAWSTAPVGVAVLDLSGEQALWLDWIGEPAAFSHASRACVAQASATGASRLVAWATPAVAKFLGEDARFEQSLIARLGIPATSALSSDEAAQARWWFMGGDTDFL